MLIAVLCVLLCSFPRVVCLMFCCVCVCPVCVCIFCPFVFALRVLMLCSLFSRVMIVLLFIYFVFDVVACLFTTRSFVCVVCVCL